AGVLATGDVVVTPVPYAFGSYIGEWRAVLGKLGSPRPKVLVPGHGPVQHDLAYVDRLGALLASLQDQVTASAREGRSLEDTRRQGALRAVPHAFARPD